MTESAPEAAALSGATSGAASTAHAGPLLSGSLQRSASAAPDGDLWLTLDAPLVAVEGLLSHPQACVVWSGQTSPAPQLPERQVPDRQLPATESYSFVGFGAHSVISAAGAGRFAQIKSRVTDVLQRMQVLPLLGAPVCAPRAFGGFAFQPGRSHNAPWQALGDARWVVPRLLYSRNAHSASLSVVVPREQRAQVHDAVAEALRLRDNLEQLATAGVARTPQLQHADEVCASEWETLVRGALADINAGQYEKLVLARRSRLQFEQALSGAATLRALAEQQPHTTLFALRAEQTLFLGATPERLLLKHGQHFATEAVAGTFRLQASALAAELLRSPKEHEEHQPVLDAIVSRLAPYAETLSYPPSPRLRELRNLMHLCTPIHGSLRLPQHILDLIEVLHPTPAVGGVPTARALDWIERHEPHERGWYAGPVGWFDAAGDGEFVVALRSGVVTDHTAFLYAGAGIVQGSDPASEYAETELKFAALRGALRATD